MKENKSNILIGVSSGWLDDVHRTVPAYIQAVIDAGATPVIIPVTDNEVVLNDILDRIDGLLLTGGGDIHPKYWGEELRPESNPPSAIRDTFDLFLVRRARQLCMPTLGICRGMQAMNVEFGGSVYQDIYSQTDRSLLSHAQSEQRHITTHTVELVMGSLLSKIMDVRSVEVNSFHHQAVKDIAPGWRVAASSSDGITEAIELPYYNMIGVQWHPENLYNYCSEHKSLFRWLVKESEIYRQARKLHNNYSIIDTHTDTPMVWNDSTDLGIRQDSDKIQVDFVKMREGCVGGVFMVAYLPQVPLNDPDYKKKAIEAHDMAVKTIERLKQQVLAHPDMVTLEQQTWHTELPQVLFGVENGFALAGDLSNIRKFYDMGVRYITLCHNGDNDICDSAKGEGTHGGLSEFGRLAVQEMNRIGMMIDVSHAADSTISQVIELSARNVIATHTSARAICNHPRNMSDEFILKLTSRKRKCRLGDIGGRIHVCLYRYFLEENGNADINTVCDHIDHIVKLTGDADCVGIGSDFDGGGGVPGCNDESELIMITMELLRRGYDTKDVAHIMGEGFSRFYSCYLHHPYE